ncbi:hypothetical protein [Methanobrevibacter sp.]|uniref:hypothetical protein n=1 Tax=Methanobrevibacter sp. TaxID=66852 RepID=UPI0026DF4A57|nr:hypothetical protein [Methanobrevibacter sp.]MDO5823289.1 hypothetical protein [Methanobrevibacter sp.]
MSEIKALIEKFIEIDDDLSEKIEKYLETSEDIDEQFEKENEAQIDELNELYHEIEHGVHNEEFFIVYNMNNEEKEIVALIISEEEDEGEEFVIPIFTDEKEADIAIEEFKNQFGDIEFELEKKIGSEIVADHTEDEEFIGVAVNAPQWDFVIASEDVHDCCE